MTMKLSSEKQHLVLENNGLVHYLVQKLGITPLSSEYEDIVSIGTIGLIKAAITFDSSKKNAFATYASKCINNEIFMHFRKVKKYANVLYLDEAIKNNNNEKDVTLGDMIEDHNANFVDSIEEKSEFICLVNIALNYLKGRERLAVLLYLMREKNISQVDIAKKMNISQSYFSRIIAKVSNEIRKVWANNKIRYKEVFSMQILGNEYKLSFSSRDIKKFNQIFATLLQNITSTEEIPDFKVNCNKERIIVQIPAHPYAFSFIAQIIQEIDDFNMTFISNKSTLTTDNTVMKKVESYEEDKTSEENESSIIVQSPEVISDAVKEKDTKSTVKRTSKVQQAIDFMLGASSFSFKYLKQKLPNMSSQTIQYAMKLAKDKGLITSTGTRGEYVPKVIEPSAAEESNQSKMTSIEKGSTMKSNIGKTK